MILVTGATGQLGQRIVEHLISRVGVSKLAVSVRDTAKAEALARRGVLVRQGDFDDPVGLVRAFAGIEKLVLVSTDGPKDVRIAQHRNAISAACAAGVKHIVYTSFVDVATDSPAEFAAVHRATEADLRASGMAITVLRNTLYADFLPMALGDALNSGVFHLPAGQGRTSFVSRDELAQAIAAAAAAPHLAKEVYELTGPAVHDYAEVAAAVARVSGKAVRYQPVAEHDYAAALTGYGLPEWLAAALANMYSAVAAGKFAVVSNDFALLVGHPAKSLDAAVAEQFAGV